MTSQIISVLNWNNTDRYNTFKMMFGGCRLLSLFTGLCESLQRRRRGQSWSNYSLFVLISQFNEMKRHPLVLKLFGLCHVGFLEAEVTIFEVDVIS